MNQDTPLPVGLLVRSENRVVTNLSPSAISSPTDCKQQLPRYLVYSALPVIAALSSLSTAVVVMLAISRDAPLASKMAAPLLAWTPTACASLWFQWYFNGCRADGLLDTRVQPSPSDALQAPGLLAIAFIASLPNFLDAVLYAHAARPKHDALFAVMVIALGIGKWLTWCLTDLQAAWRKLSEAGQVKGLSEQAGAAAFYNNAYWLNIVLRELYPPVIGLVYAQSFFQAMQSVSSSPLMNVALSLLVFQGAALSARNFDIRQNYDCSILGEQAFSMEGALAGSDQRALRTIGRVLNGQWLDDALNKIGLSAKMRTAVTLGLNGAGLMSVLHKVVTVFLFSRNSSAVAAFNEAFVLRYFTNTRHALEISRPLMPVATAVEVLLSSVQALARAATVHDQIAKDGRQFRVVQVAVAPLEPALSVAYV